jgi:phosphoribosylglycinamide formyltransferase 1
MKKTRLAVLVSGGGTNLQAIIDAIEAGKIPAEIAVVISSRKTAYALERAQKHHIPTCIIRARDYSDEQACEQVLLSCLEEYRIDLVLLAGYMSVLGDGVVARYPNRIMNVHPSLIPSFCGPGMYGARVHRDALAYGVKISGCTVMFVDEGVDTGPIILQAAVAVQDDDTVESLAARVLEQEHRLYPEAIRLFALGQLQVDGRIVKIGSQEGEKDD